MTKPDFDYESLKSDFVNFQFNHQLKPFPQTDVYISILTI